MIYFYAMYKKQFVLLCSLIVLTYSTQAQLPEDALQYSFNPTLGTARSMAIGGAMGSLGGDINATLVNPAGLAFYRTNEVMITPSFYINNNSANYRTSPSTSSKNAFAIGNIGFVGGDPTGTSKLSAFSFAITQTANFNNTTYYKGLNNFSSGAEQYAEQVSKSGLTLNGILNAPQYAYGAALAVYTYLVDTANGMVKTYPEDLIKNGQALLQENTIKTTGGITEISLGMAGNNQGKWYWGATIGVPIIAYSRNTQYKESDPSGDATNKFNYYILNNNVKTRGLGINLKLGVIYKPQEYVRLGFALHTPTFMNLTNTETADIETDTEGYKGKRSENSSKFTNGNDIESSYTTTTSLRMIVSGSYVFREVEDTRKQKGFVTAEIEYVNYSGSRFWAPSDASVGTSSYYGALNSIIRNYYKRSVLNFKIGGELKFNTIMARAGFAYYSNPYKDEALKANKTILSIGTGYRDKGIFIDLTYAYAIQKDVSFPYIIDKANTFATTNRNTGMIMLTFGSKL